MAPNNNKPIIYVGLLSIITNIATLAFITLKLTDTVFSLGVDFDEVLGIISVFLILILPIILFLLVPVILIRMKKRLTQLNGFEIFCVLLPTINLLVLCLHLVYGLYHDYPELG